MLELIKNKIIENYKKIENKDIFIDKRRLNNIYDYTYFDDIAVKYYIEILKINATCKILIEVDDIIFPIYEIIFKFKYNPITYIETLKHIYIIKKSIYIKSNFYFMLHENSIDSRKTEQKAYNYQKFFIDTLNSSKKLQKFSDEKLNIFMKLFKEKFIDDFNNKFDKLFHKLIENNENYFIMYKNNIEDDYLNITEELLYENKENIYNLLLQTQEIENNKIEKNIFNDLYYSFEFIIPKKEQKSNSQLYSKMHNNLKLNYILNGNLYLLSTKLFWFFFQENNTIIYFGDIEKQQFIKILSSIYAPQDFKTYNIVKIC